MADLAAALGSAQEPRLAGAVGREIVVMHEPLGLERGESIDPLLIRSGSQCGDSKHLGLSPTEQAGAVCSGQEADLRSQ